MSDYDVFVYPHTSGNRPYKVKMAKKNALKPLQNLVGGLIEIVYPVNYSEANTNIFIVNEEGLIKELEVNPYFPQYVGTVLMADVTFVVDEEEEDDEEISADAITLMKGFMGYATEQGFADEVSQHVGALKHQAFADSDLDDVISTFPPNMTPLFENFKEGNIDVGQLMQAIKEGYGVENLTVMSDSTGRTKQWEEAASQAGMDVTALDLDAQQMKQAKDFLNEK